MKITELAEHLDTMFPNGIVKHPISEMSDSITISDDREAYDFDAVKNHFCSKGNVISSADVLFIGQKRVSLIEFKAGFNRKGCDKDLERAKREEQRCRIRLKACESEIMLEKVVMDEKPREFELQYIAIIDGNEDILGVQEDFFIEKMGESQDKSHSEKALLIKELTENSLLMYRKQYNGKPIFYNSVEVLYDFEYNNQPNKYVR